MSCLVPIPEISIEARHQLDRQLRVKEKVDPRALYRPTQEIMAYRVEGNDVFLPFDWSVQQEAYRRHRSLRQEGRKLLHRFSGTLRAEQERIQSEALAHLNQKGSTLIAVYPGGGKTITSLSLCSKIGLRTMILVNRLVLVEQWKTSIERFYPSSTKVQIVESKTPLDPHADFYIMNAANTPKRASELYREQGIGTVIVDECHLMMTKIFVQSLSYLCPRYLIGLSATPYRSDGLDVLLDLYFGKDRVIRRLHRKHTVYVVETGLVIEGERDDKGKLSWNSVLQAQMTDPARNEFLAGLCSFFSDRTILILCKRVQQIVTLADKVRERGISCTTLKGNEVEYDTEARVLVASIQKVGTGFSHDRLDCLILACDTEEYFLQYLGRVFRRPDVVPIVIDVVDKNPVLRRHAQTRKKVYVECGGTMLDFRTCFPEVKILEAL